MKLNEITNVLNHGNTMVQPPAQVYHLTMSTRWPSIQANGLTPGRGNANYQISAPAVFCITNASDKDAIEQISSIVATAGLPAEEVHEGHVVVIRIDTKQLPNASWYIDPMHDFKFNSDSQAIWTPDTIPSAACSLMGRVSWADLSIVPM